MKSINVNLQYVRLMYESSDSLHFIPVDEQYVLLSIRIRLNDNVIFISFQILLYNDNKQASRTVIRIYSLRQYVTFWYFFFSSVLFLSFSLSLSFLLLVNDADVDAGCFSLFLIHKMTMFVFYFCQSYLHIQKSQTPLQSHFRAYAFPLTFRSPQFASLTYFSFCVILVLMFFSPIGSHSLEFNVLETFVLLFYYVPGVIVVASAIIWMTFFYCPNLISPALLVISITVI